jgi:type II secretory pathway pseudopilin PulG
MRCAAPSKQRRRTRALTLVEVMVALGIGAVLYAAILSGYILTTSRAEWTAYWLAAQALATDRLEQTRAAKWDTQAVPPVDQLVPSNFPPRVDILDLPIHGNNIPYATSIVSITVLSTNPPLKLIRADAVWSFKHRRTFTNTVITYRGPDQ